MIRRGRPFTSATARAAGSTRTPRKATAARENGQRGGRPRTRTSETERGKLLTPDAASTGELDTDAR